MELPTYKINYYRPLQNKVQSDYIIIIPKGPKCLLWFNQNKCMFIELDNHQPKKKNFEIGCFSDELCNNTLIYGTLVYINGIKYFSIENIIYYMNKYVYSYNFIYKLDLFKKIFEQFTNLHFSNSMILTLSPIYNDYTKALNVLNTLKYNVYGIAFQNKNEQYSKGILRQFKQTQNETIFHVTADLEADIYKLHRLDNSKLCFVDYALIDNLKTSKMMNRLFRKIKENDNLDSLEESDDEEEFENIKEDKFVDLTITKLIKCKYNEKFKKWVPFLVV